MFASLWRYRGFILGMVRREFQARYLNSVLGSVWAILQPLSIVLVLTVVFGRVMHTRLAGVDDGMAYGIFLGAGILTWSAFSEVLTRCLHTFVEHGNLLKKMSFPKAALPVIVLLSAAVNFAIVFAILLVFLAVSGRFPGWAILAFVPLLLVQQALALGIGMALGTLNVFFRDVSQIVTIVLQFWFWFTPIVYPVEIVGDRFGHLLALNPVTRLVTSYQNIMLGGQWPSWPQLMPQCVIAAASLLFGVIVFRRLSDEMVDYL